MKIGAHLSIAGGFHKALESIKEKGGNCLQIFSSSPRIWKDSSLEDSQIELFLRKKAELGVEPVFFHASYLINLADSDRVGKLSIQKLIFELNLAEKLEIKGSIIHLGSFKDKEPDYDLLVSNIKSVLKESPKNVWFIIENAGTRKIGKRIEEIALIMEKVGDKRVKVCLDTCHLYSAGVDLKDPEKLRKFFDKFDELIGIENLVVWHINDSRDPLGSLRDRHENLGEGSIGRQGLKNVVNFPKFKNLPFIIETPGFDQEGPDKKNISILKNLFEV